MVVKAGIEICNTGIVNTSHSNQFKSEKAGKVVRWAFHVYNLFVQPIPLIVEIPALNLGIQHLASSSSTKWKAHDHKMLDLVSDLFKNVAKVFKLCLFSPLY